MHPESLIINMLLLLAAAVFFVTLFNRLGLGSILAYLVTGVLVGPGVLGWYEDPELILHISEIGIVLFLFVIGLELAPQRLWKMRKDVFGAGSLQLFISGIIIVGITLAAGIAFNTALVVGAALALSSTAFALQLLEENKQLGKPNGKLSFAVLLFQDVSVIPLLALMPLLAVSSASPEHHTGWLDFGFGMLIIVGILVAGRYLIDPVLAWVAGNGSKEIFTAFALLLVLSVAVAIEHAGLSMGMGAFIAGVLLAESNYRHQLEADIDPFKGLLLGLFFIAVGMSMNLDVLVDNIGLLLALAVGLVILKGGVLYGVGRLFSLSNREALKFAVMLSQGGEFAFVLFAQAGALNLLGQELRDLLVLVISFSMAMTPLLLIITRRKFTRPVDLDEGIADEQLPHESVAVIAGFGRFGQIVGRIFTMHRIPFTALDKSPDNITFMQRMRLKIYYGDCTRLDMLEKANVAKAKVFVLAIADIQSSVKTAELILRHYPHVALIVRAKNRMHAYKLIDIGVKHVFRETFESSLEAALTSLFELGYPDGQAIEAVKLFREHDMRMLDRAAAHYHDEGKLTELALQGRAELEELFEQDQ